ncbi:GNAT family N-acetyltransferase [Luteibaculum oceani]|uniref:GNAT family N-acetyltransferase n=1 Tax=Luteibaculum oceani TaxID=1294296 RepID=A0A5C6UYH2_9FLAO|nr:GNAT family N-acetyltransferase [Luteibaculum oceani]TXC77106.1 GNAT family N-acetyltransferase [Luteibaculum oceani]
MAFKIIPYDPRYRKDFEAINLDWISKYFVVEDIDREVLSKPEEFILNKGGKILFALVKGVAVGTVGIMNTESMLEITKMGVLEEFRNLGIGKALFEEALVECKGMGHKKIDIFTNTKLLKAFLLYRNYGFIEIPFDQNIYKRCDARLEKYFIEDIDNSDIPFFLAEYKARVKDVEDLIPQIHPSLLQKSHPASKMKLIEHFRHLVAYEMETRMAVGCWLNGDNQKRNSLLKFPLPQGQTVENEISFNFEVYKALRYLNLNLLNSIEAEHFFTRAFYFGDQLYPSLLSWLLEAKNHNRYGHIKRIINRQS